jgi:hypothetical protein
MSRRKIDPMARLLADAPPRLRRLAEIIQRLDRRDQPAPPSILAEFDTLRLRWLDSQSPAQRELFTSQRSTP